MPFISLEHLDQTMNPNNPISRLPSSKQQPLHTPSISPNQTVQTVPSSCNPLAPESELCYAPIQTNSLYQSAQSFLMHQDGMQTNANIPVFLLTFPTNDIATAEKYRKRALEILDRKLASLQLPTTWRDWKGIKCVTKGNLPAIAIHYQLQLATTLKHYLGFPITGNGDKDVYYKFADQANPVCAEFERLWMEQTRNVSCEPTDFSYSVYNANATHLEYCHSIDELLKGNFLIGESHNHFSARNFIVQNMQFLRDHGFTWFLLENIPKEAQPLVDEYLTSDPSAPMPPQLELLVEMLGLKIILQTAKKTGMRVFCIDSMFAKRKTYGQKNPKNWGNTRCAALNQFVVEEFLNNIAPYINGKGFGLFGSNHVFCSDEGIPGILTMLKGWKSVSIYDAHDGHTRNASYVVVSHDRKSAIPPTQNAKWTYYITRITSHLHIFARDPFKMSLSNETDDALLENFPGSCGLEPHDAPLFTALPEDFRDACINGDFDEIYRLMKIDPAIVKSTYDDGKTPLHYACVNGSVQIVKYLLSKDPAIDHQDNEGMTPLHLAMQAGHLKIAYLLIVHKADASIQNHAGCTPYDLASNRKEPGNGGTVIKIRIRSNEDIEKTKKFMRTPVTSLGNNDSKHANKHVKAIVSSQEKIESAKIFVRTTRLHTVPWY